MRSIMSYNIVRMICQKIDSLEHTKGFYVKPLLQYEFGTDALTVGQRRDNILNAAKKGIKPKSKNGEYMLENYKLQDKLLKEGAQTY